MQWNVLRLQFHRSRHAYCNTFEDIPIATHFAAIWPGPFWLLNRYRSGGLPLSFYNCNYKWIKTKLAQSQNSVGRMFVAVKFASMNAMHFGWEIFWIGTIPKFGPAVTVSRFTVKVRSYSSLKMWKGACTMYYFVCVCVRAHMDKFSWLFYARSSAE